MAPPPEYDKEPKAPDKSATNISTEDSKLLQNLVNDQHTNSDHKSTNTVTAVEIENNKHVETLDDGQLKALLDEAINYKNPKDREGKSDIFKELLEKAEQESDEQACEAAARTLSGCRSTRRGGRRGPQLPHSNSLQDLVAALAAEQPRKHHVRHQPPPHNVSARAIHGGSLPSGVDTSSLSEEPARGAGYLATVRCVNPPPLAERRVSASDANAPAEMELLNRRSKPVFPMTYTARATLEIGSGAVCSGRAVTTTTASNQVRTTTSATTTATTRQVHASDPQVKLMNALCPRTDTEKGGCDPIPQVKDKDHLNIKEPDTESATITDLKGKTNKPRGPKVDNKEDCRKLPKGDFEPVKEKPYIEKCPQSWVENVDNWYRSLPLNYPENLKNMYKDIFKFNKPNNNTEIANVQTPKDSEIDPFLYPKPAALSTHEVISTEDDDIGKALYKFGDADPVHRSPKFNESKFQKESHNLRRKSYQETLTETYSEFEYDISKRKLKKTHSLVVPSLCDINPRNIRPMSIGGPKIDSQSNLKKNEPVKTSQENSEYSDIAIDINSNTVNIESKNTPECVDKTSHNDKGAHTEQPIMKCTAGCCDTSKKREQLKELTDMFNRVSNCARADIELKEMKSKRSQKDTNDSFSKYVTLQQNLLLEIQSLEEEIKNHEHVEISTNDADSKESQNNTNTQLNNEEHQPIANATSKDSLEIVPLSSICEETNEGVKNDSNISAELSNNAYVLLTLPSSNNTEYFVSESTKPKSTKKKDNLCLAPSHTNKKEEVLNKNILKVLLFENLFKNNNNEKSGTSEVSAIINDEVDSAISFSCITTPEVVASCNTTSSTTQSAVAVDPKPLQLGSCYRAVLSIMGDAEPPEARRSPQRSPRHSPRHSPQRSPRHSPREQPAAPDPGPALGSSAQPRSVISSSFNGLPMSRPGYGATGTAAPDEYKKSIDENGNSVQGFSSPLSGSSQHKKPRRKKSSKNETVIDCQQIDGYQGDKDVNELLRFIESNAEHGRGGKLRVKHRDDADDKGKKRRKDKESKPKRASSLEELSRTTLEELTAPRAAPPPRRSWGERAPEPPAPPAAAPAETDFQTVTKKRRARRRTDDGEREPPRRRAPGPRRRESAPPSERSADSNDDLDSVHSLPDAPRAPPPPAQASYADIARTRHNIPDLIESCNFYAEGEGAPRKEPAPPHDADGYPALDARLPAARRRDKAPPPARRERKERAPPPDAADGPAPDVVADRRPPVILLDSAARPRDMDGVTFGFDINEQLLSGGARRARCDLLRDALPPAALRYVPPPAPPAAHHLAQIVDYVGSAWEDVVRCGSGKVRYFSE